MNGLRENHEDVHFGLASLLTGKFKYVSLYIGCVSICSYKYMHITSIFSLLKTDTNGYLKLHG